MNYYHILLKHIPQLLTYQAEDEIPLGSLISTTLGKRTVNGVVLKKVEKPSYDCVSIREVLIIRAISSLQIQLCQWMSSYYFASLRKCVQLFIPTPVWNQKPKLKIKEGEILNPDYEHHSKPHHKQALTKDQQQVLKSILSPNNHTNFLLHGITGSGKTEIYLQLIKKSIQKGKQSLLLVPEIGLTTELIQYFTDQFHDQISIVHSKRSAGERIQAWHRIHQGKTKLIIGSRSALFTPWRDLDTIIIDEEHEWTYKQESSPRYHAKKVAEKIIELNIQNQKAKKQPTTILLLGSATPSIESYYQSTRSHNKLKNPNNPTYTLLTLKNRATNHSLPSVIIVDLRDEFRKKNFSMFSTLLQENIQKRLEKKEQVILFLNKRGSSSSITCRDCGYTPTCKNCDITLTLHLNLRDFEKGGIICHYCGYFEVNPENCPRCKSHAIKFLGTGTQKAEKELQELFPKARILRADKDNTSGKHDFELMSHKMRTGKADILIGTQMIAKGLDLPKVTLTGIILADIGLHVPDFRTNERVFQLLTQVAGRSGRHLVGEVIIQTYQPDHPSIQAAKNHDFESFYKNEIYNREQYFYSPFSNEIRLVFADKNAKKARNEANKLHSVLSSIQSENFKKYKDLKIFLSPHYIPRLHGKYIWNNTIRGKNPREILNNELIPTGWKIDVDPR